MNLIVHVVSLSFFVCLKEQKHSTSTGKYHNIFFEKNWILICTVTQKEILNCRRAFWSSSRAAPNVKLDLILGQISVIKCA